MSTASIQHVLDTLKQQGVAIVGVSSDSRTVKAGDVFLAYPGDESDGRNYITDAIAKGAVAVVYEEKAAPAITISVPHIAVPELKRLAGPIAAEVYGQPSKALHLIGVTGTNGKTSITQWLGRVFTEIGQRCALVGTLGNGFPGALRPSPNTTPDAVVLQRELKGFLNEGATVCAMEVSSIGLEEGRVEGCHFDTAVFTNFTRDHLDYHGSMSAYAAAKSKLFTREGLKTAVVNLDDGFGRIMARQLAGKVRCIGYAFSAEAADEVMIDELLLGSELEHHGASVSFKVNGVPVNVPVIGRFNGSNVLAVIGALRAADVPLANACAVTGILEAPAGRMQVLGGVDAPLVVIDYAHTPDALMQVLNTLREIANARGGNLSCVFGCGGDRDPGKRPEMGQIVGYRADSVFVTSDNPRSEDPQNIIEQICAGMDEKELAKTTIESDRAQAIQLAVSRAAVADVVLLAGKGHETYQEIAGVRHPFNDLTQAQQALAQHNQGAQP